MEKPPISNPDSSNVKPLIKSTKTNLMGSFIFTVFLALSLGLIHQVITLPKACTENPQSSIMKMESQIQEDIDRTVYDWLESSMTTNLKLLQYLDFALIFLLLSFTYFKVNSLYKKSAIETLAVFVSFFGCWFLIFILMRDFLFQNSSEDCIIGLTRNLHIIQNLSMFYFVMLAFIAFQQFLTKNCEKST